MTSTTNLESVTFDWDLIQRYDVSGPRYTSYPTAPQFRNADASNYLAAIKGCDFTVRPLSLYLHIPFCNTVCFFCACNKFVTGRQEVAAPYLQTLISEINRIADLLPPSKPRISQLHWGGGTPTFLDNQQIEQLVAALGDRFTVAEEQRNEYSLEIDPRSVDDAKIKVLADCGFTRMSMGVQDFTPEVQQAVNRIQSVEITRSAIEAARKYGFTSINIDLIYGLPKQSRLSFSETLKTVIALRPDRLSVFNYAHLPALFKPQQRIRGKDLPHPEEKLELLQSAIDMLQEAGYLYIGMDHFALPEDELAQAQRNGCLHRNFQGYTTQGGCDLIGLGVSAISMFDHAYFQNAKILSDYYQDLDDGGLSTRKELLLNSEDKIRRRAIFHLICNFKLEYSRLDEEFAIDSHALFARERKELLSFAEDGLLTLEEDAITVTSSGRLLIRNICMVFDSYFTSDVRIRPGRRYSRVI